MNSALTCKVKYAPEEFMALPEDYYKDGENDTEEVSYLVSCWRRLSENKIAMVSLAVIVLVVIFAVIGPMLLPYTYDQQIRGEENLWPCPMHPFGTDRLGRDLLVRCMIGTRISLVVGTISAVIVLMIGSAYGSIAGLAGGKTDMIMMRLAEIIYSVPEILLIIVIKLVIDEPLTNLIDTNPLFQPLQKIGSGLIAIFIVYGCLYWVGMARIVRGQVLQLKQQEYISAADALGASKKWLILQHLIPNCIGQLVATTMLQIPSAIFTEAFLSFLGMGVSAPMASLGSLTSDALAGINKAPYRMFFPALIISLIILCFNLFGDGLRDALDPQMKKR